MVISLYSISHEPLPMFLLRRYLSYVSESCKDKITKLKRWQDVNNGILARVLLLEGLKRYGHNLNWLPPINYGLHHKPYIALDVEFNISHSDNMVICALSDEGTIGVDIEKIKAVAISDFNFQFSSKELHDINLSQNPLREFYRYWTKKEAVIKADGRGLNIPLNNINVLQNSGSIFLDTQWYLYELPIDNEYVGHVAVPAELTHDLKVDYVDLTSVPYPLLS